jgi:photosystem II stability/assembly factor-like uncharacterized protein
MLDPIRSRIRDDVLSSYEDPAPDLTRRVLAVLPARPPQRRSPLPALAVTAALVLIAAAVLGARAAHLFSIGTVATPSEGLRPPSASYSIVDNQFVSASTGWILIQMHTTSGPLVLLKTSDGGDHWVEQFRYSGPGSIDDIQFASNGRDGWMTWVAGGAAVPAGQPLPPNNDVIVRTTYVTRDGGDHWVVARKTSTPNPPKTAPLPTYWPASQTFYLPNGLEGWGLLVPTNRQADLPVMHTTDGGVSWTRVGTLPAGTAEGQLSFSDPRTGWLSMNSSRTFAWDAQGRPLPSIAPPALLFVTHDGGATWKAPVLQLPAAASSPATVTALGLPDMLDATHGLLTLQLSSAPTGPSVGTPTSGTAPTSFVLKTVDGGDHWGSLTEVSGASTGWDLLFMSFDHWLAGGGGLVRETADGGRSWSTPRRVLADGLELSLAPSDYIRPNVIWVQVGAGSLVRSTDGGKHWSAVTPPEVK